MFEVYVSLTSMYWLQCVTKSHNMREFNKILNDLSVKKHEILMEKLRKNESGELKNIIQYEFFSNFINNTLKNIK